MINEGKTLEGIAVEVAALCSKKREAYGDSFSGAGRVLRELYPNGIHSAQYDDLLAVTRMLDKLFRLATSPNAFGESPWMDLAGYALLGLAASRARKPKET